MAGPVGPIGPAGAGLCGLHMANRRRMYPFIRAIMPRPVPVVGATGAGAGTLVGAVGFTTGPGVDDEPQVDGP